MECETEEAVTKSQQPDLSRAEYEVLRQLWKAGDSSVREVHDRLTTGWAYSTTKTVMDRMVGKDLLERKQIHGVYVYVALISRPVGLANMVRYFAERVLELEPATVISMFAQGDSLSQREIEELTRILESQKNTEEA